MIGDTESEGWQQRVEHFLGRPLAAIEAGKKRRSSGVSLRWLRQQFSGVPTQRRRLDRDILLSGLRPAHVWYGSLP